MRPRLSILVMVTAVFLLGFFIGRLSNSPAATYQTDSPSPAKLALPAGLAVVGFLDQVDGKPEIPVTAGSDFHISGWAACADPQAHPAKLEILIDNQPQAKTVTPAPRPDVASAYGRPDFAKSGWKTDLSTRNLAAGSHPITARVSCTNGQAGVIPAFQLIVKAP